MGFGKVRASVGVLLPALIAVVSPASGQLASRPVYLDPGPALSVTELTIAVGYGHGYRAVSNRRLLNGDIALGFGHVRIRAAAGALTSGEGGQQTQTARAADITLQLKETIQFPVLSLLFGIGHHAIDDSLAGDVAQIDFPLGLGVGVYAPTPSGITARLWLGPRFQMRYTSREVGQLKSSDWNAGGGLSIGLACRLPGEIMAQLAADWLMINDAFDPKTHHEVTIGLGVGYRFSF